MYIQYMQCITFILNIYIVIFRYIYAGHGYP